jgi:predicted RND superfamily exporter protein
MTLPDLIARWVVRRPWWVAAIALLLVIGAVFIVQRHARFDSEVLNLLPSGSEAVRAMKSLNSDFVQARELTFVLRGKPEQVEEFADYFVEKLRREPWTQRTFASSPIENPDDLASLQSVIPSLLLNLDESAFRAALQNIEPGQVTERVRRLKAEIEAGSARAELTIATDALGLLGPALGPLNVGGDLEKGPSLGSPDGRLRIVPVVTNQASLDQPACAELMQRVNRFKERVRAEWKGSTAAPVVLVTGRSAYVAEIADSMRRDIQLTSIVSILAVSGLFYFGFRRLLPLVGITLILGLSCFLAFALGCLAFQNLNLIAVGFCSILVGLGDDFSLLLFNRYLQARAGAEEHEQAIATSIRDVGRGIIYVAITTGIGFLALVASKSVGFAQLGVLIAVGVVLCGLLMITLLFLFIRPQQAAVHADLFQGLVQRYVAYIMSNSRRLAVPMVLLLIACGLFVVLPIRALHFDTNPRTLEPKQSAAAQALKAITDSIPAIGEPIAIIVEANDAQDAHDRWKRLSAHLKILLEQGKLRGYSTPAAFFVSPSQMAGNQKILRGFDLAASKAAFIRALDESGFSHDAFTSSLTFFDRLQSAAQADPASLADFHALLPPESTWWFILERFFSSRRFVSAAYVRPTQMPATAEAQLAFEQEIKASNVPLSVTGWSYAMISLVPWARHELILFSSCVGGLILLMLGWVYRAWRPWIIHAASLIFAIVATITTLKLTGIRLNLLNALAFPLILGVGVDYGLHVLMAAREAEEGHAPLQTVLKPLIICGLTTITGFGSLMLARNPALSGLGTLCALGVFWCLVSSVLFALPMYFASRRRGRETSNAQHPTSNIQ